MKLTLIFFVFLFLSSPFLFAQDGVLDPTFNSTGKVTTSFSSAYDYGKSVAIQSDGKIVVAGVYSNSTTDDFAVARYNSDGTLDGGFGTGGKVTTSIGSHNDAGYGVAIQSDGKIVVVGATSNGTNNDIAVVRYNSNGTLDGGFGTGGIVTTAVGSSDNPGNGVAIQSDGKIVVVGYAHIGLTDDFMIVRYTDVGALDAGFGASGIVTTPIGSVGDVANSVAIQADGKIVAAGYTFNGTNDDFAVVRYNSDGTLDTGFGTGGKVTTAIGSAEDIGYSVAIQADGKIVVVGYAHMSTDDFAVVRYTSGGVLDPTFNSTGKVTTDFGSGTDWAYSVALQLDGKIVVAGFAFSSATKIGVVRYNSDGTLDNPFGISGKVTTAIGSSGDYGNSVALQADGKIVVAGSSYNSGSDADFAVVRYSGSSGPLPVELTSFTASVIISSVELKWVTVTEVNNYGFEVERRQSAQRVELSTDWVKVGFVAGAGTSNSPRNYFYTDNNLSAGSYTYRLKQIDNNGAFTYGTSAEVEIGLMPQAFALLQNYPNPFNPSTSIQYSLEKAGMVSLKVYNLLGQEVATLVNGPLEAGSYSVPFNTNTGTLSLSSGVYFYRLEAGSFVSTKKLILMK